MEINSHNTIGKVYLVGAGPGDPELITVKGLRRLQQADAIVYDYLVNPQLLDYARTGAELIYAGKQGHGPSISQSEINFLLQKLTGEGKNVVRLKGGDPFVFGRGGEEAFALHQAGIEFEIVPGISSAIAAPAYAGIPLTHRDYSSSFTVITGHEDSRRTSAESRLDWEGLARQRGTLVILMGLKQLGEINLRLVAGGLCENTPVALIQWGTTPQQKVVTGTLANIRDMAVQAAISAPVVIVVGEVVRLRENLEWFSANIPK